MSGFQASGSAGLTNEAKDHALTELLRRIDRSNLDIDVAANVLLHFEWDVPRTLAYFQQLYMDFRYNPDAKNLIADHCPGPVDQKVVPPPRPDVSLLRRTFWTWKTFWEKPRWVNLLNKVLERRKRLDFRRRLAGQIGPNLTRLYADGKITHSKLGDPIMYRDPKK